VIQRKEADSLNRIALFEACEVNVKHCFTLKIHWKLSMPGEQAWSYYLHRREMGFAANWM
jgi:hypothetical protein